MKDKQNKFLHRIQQPKMKELWDNAEDKAWERLLKPKPRHALTGETIK